MSEIETGSRQQSPQSQQYIRCPKCHRIIASRRVDADGAVIEIIVRNRVHVAIKTGMLTCLYPDCNGVVAIEQKQKRDMPDAETIFRALR